jgi:hypothetical protein
LAAVHGASRLFWRNKFLEPGGDGDAAVSIGTSKSQSSKFQKEIPNSVIFAGGGANELMAGTRSYSTTGIVARGRIYVGADNKVYAFFPPFIDPTCDRACGSRPTPTPELQDLFHGRDGTESIRALSGSTRSVQSCERSLDRLRSSNTASTVARFGDNVQTGSVFAAFPVSNAA